MKNSMIETVVKRVYEIKCDVLGVDRKGNKKGVKYCDIHSIDPAFHWSKENSKVGRAFGINFPIFYTCRHDCECYKGYIDDKGNYHSGACYGQCGCYSFPRNQMLYAENYKFYVTDPAAWWTTLQNTLDTEAKKYELVRFFEIGDFPRLAFVKELVQFALNNPDRKIWCYTKKYDFVNAYCDMYGVDSIPENLVILFSHWMNNDGSYLPMNNKYNFPTSEFIPVGKEYLAETVTHICPCSDPNVVATCETCEHPCYELKHGESMALLEHSTSETKARDKAIRAAKAALEKALKAIA